VSDPMQINTATAGHDPRRRYASALRTKARVLIGTLAMTMFIASGAFAAAPTVDESQLLGLGFKVLVATTKVQEDWVRSLAPGEIRQVQRTGKKFFIYPDSSRNRIFVGGPVEYEAYRNAYPERQQSAQDAAAKASAYRGKQDAEMRKATARDLSDPFLGLSWADLGW